MDSLVPWLIVSLIPWWIWWFIDSLIVWFIDCLSHRFIGSTSLWFNESLVHGFKDWFIDLLIRRFIASLIHRFIDLFSQRRCMDSFMSFPWHFNSHLLIRWCISELQHFVGSTVQLIFFSIGHVPRITCFIFFRIYRLPGMKTFECKSSTAFWRYVCLA